MNKESEVKIEEGCVVEATADRYLSDEFEIKVLNDVSKIYSKCIEEEYSCESDMLEDLLNIIFYVNKRAESKIEESNVLLSI